MVLSFFRVQITFASTGDVINKIAIVPKTALIANVVKNWAFFTASSVNIQRHKAGSQNRGSFYYDIFIDRIFNIDK